MRRFIMRVRHGSHLYGTSTPQSDVDWRGVHLPSAAEILLCRPQACVDTSTKTDVRAKNTADDVDEQSYSLQKFLDMLAGGDMIAHEMLYAPVDQLDVCTEEWLQILDMREQLVSRECRGFVGYVQRQAAKYGIKGSRMAAVRAVLLELDECIRQGGPKDRLGEHAVRWQGFVQMHQHSELQNIPLPSGADMWHLVVCDRKMPYRVTLETARAVWQRVFDEYGSRARAAERSDGVDWKAVGHAVRVGQQAVELLRTGTITMPRPNAEELLAIRRGEREYGEIAAILEGLLAEVEELGLKSTLPELPDRALMDGIVGALHLRAVMAMYQDGRDRGMLEWATGSIDCCPAPQDGAE